MAMMMTMADVMVGLVMAGAFLMVTMIGLAMYDPKPLEYL